MKTKLILTTSAVAALALPGAAGAAKPTTAPNAKAPGQACKAESKKKVEGQAKSAFAACVSGFKKQQAAEQQAAETKTKAPNPAQTCKGQSKKKAEGQKKSAYAACVSGAAKAQEQTEEPQAPQA